MVAVDLVAVRRLHPDGTVALAGIDLHVDDGEILGVVGPSGSGKSTLLRVVAGLEPLDTGIVALDGRDVAGLPPRQRNVALVAQQHTLYDFLTVAEQLAFPLEVRQLGRQEVARRITAERRAFRLGRLWRRRPRQLAGGEVQRTAVARALVRLPDVLLLDEPLQRLDPPAQARLREELLRLHRARPTTTLYASNDHAQVLTVADRVLVLRDGRVAQVGTPAALLGRPDSRWVAGFLGPTPMSFVDAEVVDDAGLGWLGIGAQRLRVPGRLPGPLRDRAGSRVVLGARPDMVTATAPEDPADVRLTGTVRRVAVLGPHDEVDVELPAGRWWATFPSGSAPGRGDRVEVTVAVRRLSVFDAEDGSALWHGG